MTPRPYLSWSSMDLLERDEKKWIQVYLYGEKNMINRGMAYGKQMADGLENDEATGDTILDLVIAKLPKFEIMDKILTDEKGKEIEYFDRTSGKMILVKVPVLKCGKEKIPIIVKCDTMKVDMSAFKEYKTGQEPWSKKKVDDSGQITFYATGGFLKTGKIASDIELVHIQTAKQGDGQLDARIGATGEINRHPTRRTMGQILNMMVRMKKAWERMEKLTAEELL